MHIRGIIMSSKKSIHIFIHEYNFSLRFLYFRKKNYIGIFRFVLLIPTINTNHVVLAIHVRLANVMFYLLL